MRRGKFLWMPIGDDRAIVGHLGMSGQLLLRTPDHPGDDRHARVRLHLDHPEHGELRIDFVDQRTFGSLAVDRLVPTADGEVAGFSAGVSGPWARSIPAQVAHIARDPLDPAFDDRGFLDALARRASGVKRVLLDQGLVSGVGNIYADESLWAVRLHGEQPASSLTRRRGRELLAAVRDVLGKALAEGGTSFDAQYVNVNGASGYFAHSLNAYGRAGPALSALRHADGARVVHEPLVAPVPALPAAPDAAAGRCHVDSSANGRKPSATLIASMCSFSSAFHV